MKALLATVAMCALLSGAVHAADPAAPADKKDSGSLSSGAKEAMPATKKQGENAPTGNEGSAASGSSSGTAGDDGAGMSTGNAAPKAGNNEAPEK